MSNSLMLLLCFPLCQYVTRDKPVGWASSFLTCSCAAISYGGYIQLNGRTSCISCACFRVSDCVVKCFSLPRLPSLLAALHPAVLHLNVESCRCMFHNDVKVLCKRCLCSITVPRLQGHDKVQLIHWLFQLQTHSRLYCSLYLINVVHEAGQPYSSRYYSDRCKKINNSGGA